MNALEAKELYEQTVLNRYNQLVQNEIPDLMKTSIRNLKNYTKLNVTYFPDHLVDKLKTYLQEQKFTVSVTTEHGHASDSYILIRW